MSLHNPYASLFRERILGFGGPGMGKSRAFYDIARMSFRTGSDARFYVVDTDESYGRMLSDPDYRDILLDASGAPVNMVCTQVRDWETLTRAVDTFQKIMRPQDWLMIDMLSPTWAWVQRFYTNEVFKMGMDEYLLEHRKQMQKKKDDKNSGAFDGWKDWSYINDLYESLQMKLLRSPGNLYCTAEVKAFGSANASKEDRIMFGPLGVVPVGQKRTPHQFQSVVLFHALREGEWLVSNVAKDRARTRLQGVPMNDFAIDYLVNAGGWKLTEAPAQEAA